MTTQLNHDVLKRTHSLLAEIDMVLAAPSLAERVERLLQSACAASSRLTEEAMEHFDAICELWMQPDCDDDYPSIVAAASRHEVNGGYIPYESINACGCERLDITYVEPYREDWCEEEGDVVIFEGPHLRTTSQLECEVYAPGKHYPISPRWTVFTDSAFRQACTFEGCGCNAVFADGADPYEYEEPDYVLTDDD